MLCVVDRWVLNEATPHGGHWRQVHMHTRSSGLVTHLDNTRRHGDASCIERHNT